MNITQELIRLASTPLGAGETKFYSLDQLRTFHAQLGSVQAIQEVAQDAKDRGIAFTAALNSRKPING